MSSTVRWECGVTSFLLRTGSHIPRFHPYLVLTYYWKAIVFSHWRFSYCAAIFQPFSVPLWRVNGSVGTTERIRMHLICNCRGKLSKNWRKHVQALRSSRHLARSDRSDDKLSKIVFTLLIGNVLKASRSSQRPSVYVQTGPRVTVTRKREISALKFWFTFPPWELVRSSVVPVSRLNSFLFLFFFLGTKGSLWGRVIESVSCNDAPRIVFQRGIKIPCNYFVWKLYSIDTYSGRRVRFRDAIWIVIFIERVTKCLSFFVVFLLLFVTVR